jgi:hypothetical protein
LGSSTFKSDLGADGALFDIKKLLRSDEEAWGFALGALSELGAGLGIPAITMSSSSSLIPPVG